jgi:IS1 family transposase
MKNIRTCPSQWTYGLKKGRLTVQCDEMWSFVGHKGNQQWIGLAWDVETREIVGVYVGNRSRESAQGLWDALPAVYRQCAVSYTDFWSAYDEVFPSKQHQSVGKESGKTSYIERFNCAMRQRVSCLERKTLSSKKLENHIGVIWYFVHHDNSSLLLQDYPILHKH